VGRGEQTAAVALLAALPALDGQPLTADPLHCQQSHARTIVDKGGDYLFQIQGNQFKPLQRVQAPDARWRHPLFTHTECGHGRVQTWQWHLFGIDPLTADFPSARTCATCCWRF
jgi:hypothetical protein